MMKFFNTLGGNVQQFEPITPGLVKLYSCGPTVYDYAHIGNLSAFLFVDFLRRWLEFKGFKVLHVMNLTDVDDKTIRRSRTEGKTLSTLCNFYAETFFTDLQRLKIKPAHVFPKATEHIPEMVALIKKLLKAGCAYEQGGSIYFRISAFPEYGHLSRLDKRTIATGASGIDADEYVKENVCDFVLWKAWKKDEDGEVYWDTEIGRGRPGWHIECSAMSMKYLGESFDIHTGGIDLIFPHHENEIAQSEAATGKKFVNYWLHRAHLRFGGGKMSKSLGTIKSLSDIVKTPLDAAAFRYLIFANHYRSALNFNDAVMASARNTVKHLRNFKESLAIITADGPSIVDEMIANAQARYIQEMDNDLNTPRALAAIFQMIAQVESVKQKTPLSKASATTVLNFLSEIDKIIDVFNWDENEATLILSPEQQQLVDLRTNARNNSNWSEADRLRALLHSKGIRIEDTPTETICYPA